MYTKIVLQPLPLHLVGHFAKVCEGHQYHQEHKSLGRNPNPGFRGKSTGFKHSLIGMDKRLSELADATTARPTYLHLSPEASFPNPK